MKKFISSVLVFTLMGVPAVSSAFAANNKEILADLNSQKQQIVESLNKLYDELVDNEENCDKENFVKRAEELWKEFDKVESSIKEIKEQKETKKDSNVSENTQNVVKSENQDEFDKNKEEQEIKETEQKKAGMSNTKKVLITLGVIAAVAGAGYAAYNYCPLVQEFVKNTAIPYAKGLGNKMATSCSNVKTKANEYYESGKNFMSDAAKDLGSKIATFSNNMKTKVNGGYKTVKNFTSNTVKSLINKANEYSESVKKSISDTAQNLDDKMTTLKTKINGCYESSKNFTSDTAKNLGNKASKYYDSVKDFTNQKAIPYIKNLGKNVGRKLTEQYVAIKTLNCFKSVKNYISSKVKSLTNRNGNNQSSTEIPMLGK